jgi:hypothetical protein
LKDHQAHRANPVHRVFRGFKESLDQSAPKVTQAMLGRRDLKVSRAHPVNQAYRVKQGQQVHKESKANLDPRVIKVIPE